MKKFTLFIFVIFVSVKMVAAQSTIGGPIFNDTILTKANSPYHVVSDILITIGVTVTLEPGVHLQFDDLKKMVVDGILHANGTPADSIFFEAYNPAAVGATWWGISFSNTTIPYDSVNETGSIINYCSFKHGGYQDGNYSHNAVSIDAANYMLVMNSTFSDYMMGVSINGAGNKVLNCVFKNHVSSTNNYSGVTIYNAFGPRPNNPDVVRNCLFDNHQDNAIDIFTPAIIENNCFLHCSIDASVYCCNTVIPVIEIYTDAAVRIENNYIASACNSGISLMMSCDSTVVISHNTFDNNLVDIVMSKCMRSPKIIENNFFKCYIAHVYCSLNLIPNFGCQPIGGSYYTIDLSSNYFGGKTPAQVDSALYDLYDDIGTKVIFSHATTATDTILVSSLHACNYVPTANCFDSTVTAIHNERLQDELTVFPNPSPGDFTLRYHSKSDDKISITVSDLSGRTMQHYPFIKTNSDFRFGIELKAGIYLLEVLIERERKVMKIMKE